MIRTIEAHTWQPAPTLLEIRCGAHLVCGHTGPAVEAVQAMLGVKVTGHYGGRTVRAVRALQRELGTLPPTGAMGVVGPGTLALLEGLHGRCAA